ncbi:MAG TPA: site-2 protease family protein [Longimicrobiales bacterium]|nr:site-2 protease family protein [Longimicrobiales bacterium]
MDILLFLPVLLFSVVLHEVAHGWVALKQGDDTAQRAGRLTLNPIPHIDLFGSIIVPAVLWLAPGRVLFGWAKPVPVDPRQYRHYRRGDILVSLAGIAANLLLAVSFTLLVVLLTYLARLAPPLLSILTIVAGMARIGILLNLILAFFNLIPIPPLDGSHVLAQLLPARMRAGYRQMGRYGLLILMGLLFLAPSALETLLWPALALDRLAVSFIHLVA